MAPPEKKQRVEEEKKQETKDDENVDMAEGEEAGEQSEGPEAPKELETDEPESRARLPKIKDAVAFFPSETTLNLLPATTNNILTPLTEGGIQHFLTGARASVGISKGRYMFEAKLVQNVNLAHALQNPTGPRAKHYLRIGFSTAKSCLILGSSPTDVCFDSDGVFWHNKERTPLKFKFGRDDVLAVVLNLDKDSQNYNTISMFKNGQRVCQPQALPEALQGQTLYPHLSFKGVSVHANFGPCPLASLPFTCRMVQDAVKAECIETKPPASGKSEVLFPVSLPDEGTFDWLDMFLEKNPNYVELSDRMILDWALRSGLTTKTNQQITSNDKPEFNFQVKELDDGSVRKTIFSAAPLAARNYVIMKVRGNLLKEDRVSLLSKFDSSTFKKTSVVMVGEPNTEFKNRVQSTMLQEKQAIETKTFETKKQEEKRKRILAKKQKEVEKLKKKAEKKRKKEAEAAKKKIEAIKKAKEAKEKGEEPPAVEDEEPQEEPASEEEPEEEEPVEMDEEPPKAELTEEEKKMNFRSRKVKDLTAKALSSSFAKFTIPTADEGFDEIKCEWIKTAGKASEHVKTWITDKKLTTRVEDIKPSEWFQQRWKSWQVVLAKWHAKHAEYKAALQKKAALKAAKEAKAKAKAAAAAAAEAKREAAKARGEEVPEEEAKPAEEPAEEQEEEEEEPAKIDDVFAVDDLLDVGGGKPLFFEFLNEDWTMLSLRFELHLLAHAFKRDCCDDERPGIFLDHLPFYYQRYYKKQLVCKEFGVESLNELVALVQDTMFVAAKSVLESQVMEDLETPDVFCKLTEMARRHRHLLIALGDDSVKLKLSVGASQQHQQQQHQQQQQQGGGNKWHGGGNKWQGGAAGHPRPWQQQQHHQQSEQQHKQHHQAGGWQSRQKGSGPIPAASSATNWHQPQGNYSKVIAPGRGGAIAPYGYSAKGSGAKGGSKGDRSRWTGKH